MRYNEFYNYLLKEAFETLADFLLNPKHSELEWYELIRKFESSGGIVLGKGKYATVLEHPSWKYVLKVFNEDVPYLKFVRFCIKNPRQSFPVFYDKPRRIVPFYKRHWTQSHLYVVKMEKLNPIDRWTFTDIDYYLNTHQHFIDDMRVKSPSNETWITIKNKLNNIEKKYPSVVQFKEDYQFLLTQNINLHFGHLDLHYKNVMRRSNGQFVLSDPLWSGVDPSTPQNLFQPELNPNHQNMIKGGRLAATQKKKPVELPSMSQISNDVSYGDDFSVG